MDGTDTDEDERQAVKTNWDNMFKYTCKLCTNE